MVIYFVSSILATFHINCKAQRKKAWKIVRGVLVSLFVFCD